MKRIAILATLCTSFVTLATADHRVMLRWQGEVDGVTRLVIEGDQVRVENSNMYGQPNYRFDQPLPAAPVNVEVNVRQGRGNVRVIEQPTARNNYSAVVQIRPGNRAARELYDLEFLWDDRNNRGRRQSGGVFSPDYDDRGTYNTRNRRAGAGAGYGEISWTGTVDDEAIIEFRNRRVTERTVRGRAAITQNADFSSPVPRNDVQMQIIDGRGRGRVELIEQPSRSNNYTTRVRITDPDSGAGQYSFLLRWEDSYASSGSGFPSTGGGVFDPAPTGTLTGGGNEMRWSGRVDGRIRVIVDGSRARYQVLSGQPPREVQFQAGAQLPNYAANVDIDREHGRDEVRLIERPSPGNGYRLVFEIDDSSSGADFYEVRIRW